MKTIAPMLGLLILCWSADAAAFQCTIGGFVQVQSQDSYYCDTSVAGNDCAGWSYTNLDTIPQPLRYMRVVIESLEGEELVWTRTDSVGMFSATLQSGGSGNCGSVRVRFDFERYRDLTDTERIFRIVSGDEDTTYSTLSVPYTFGSGTCTPTSCPADQTFSGTGATARRATIFRTADSALGQAITWSTNISNQFDKNTDATDGSGVLRIVVLSSYEEISYFNPDEWWVKLAYSMWRAGGNTRHELGHAIHEAIHHRKQKNVCESYNFNNAVPVGHPADGCEYAFAAMTEGMATFFAVRTVYTTMSAGKGNAWFCFCADSTNQDVCSETAVAPKDGDRIQDCVGLPNSFAFIGVGDSYASSKTHCTDLQTGFGGGCNCAGPLLCSNAFNEANGHRTEVQNTRFLWDAIDKNDDSNLDNSELNMDELVHDLEAMPCTDPGGFGQDWDCNEPNRSNAANCVPADGTIPTAPMLGTRDSYNAYDVSHALSVPQAGERELNCLLGAVP